MKGTGYCENRMKDACESFPDPVTETRYLPLLTGPGRQALCRACFEKEVQWRQRGGLYPGRMTVPQWEEARVNGRKSP